MTMRVVEARHKKASAERLPARVRPGKCQQSGFGTNRDNAAICRSDGVSIRVCC